MTVTRRVVPLSQRSGDWFFVLAFSVFAFTSFFSDALAGLGVEFRPDSASFWNRANYWYAADTDPYFLTHPVHLRVRLRPVLCGSGLRLRHREGLGPPAGHHLRFGDGVRYAHLSRQRVSRRPATNELCKVRGLQFSVSPGAADARLPHAPRIPVQRAADLHRVARRGQGEADGEHGDVKRPA